MNKEHELQTACVAWFRAQYPRLSLVLFATPNAGRRTRWEAQMLKAEGMVAGVADLLLLVPNRDYHGLCIEMKREENKFVNGKATTLRTYQRPNQKVWQKAVEEQGYRYVICHTFEEFHDEVNDYLSRTETP